MPHRQPLIRALEDYDSRFPEEKALTARFRRFVEEHPDCFDRSLKIGHLTGASWIVDAAGDRVLLTHHRKLNRWLQPGGHADGDPDIHRVAFKEAIEETGLEPLISAGPAIFDLDIHPIPARKDEPRHEHFDVRFLFQHTGNGHFFVSPESHDLAWVDLDQLTDFTREESILRMAEKWREIRASPSPLIETKPPS